MIVGTRTTCLIGYQNHHQSHIRFMSETHFKYDLHADKTISMRPFRVINAWKNIKISKEKFLNVLRVLTKPILYVSDQQKKSDYRLFSIKFQNKIILCNIAVAPANFVWVNLCKQYIHYQVYVLNKRCIYAYSVWYIIICTFYIYEYSFSEITSLILHGTSEYERHVL